MRFDVITLFPQMFPPFLEYGITRRAYADAMQVHLWNPRDFAQGNYRRVDERPFGGGPGMVMMAEPLALCLEEVRKVAGDEAPLILFSPAGEKLSQSQVETRANSGRGAILLCGRYEGVDQRFIDAYVDEQISLGDFVLSGGELGALVLLDAIARLQPGVLGDSASFEQDSFSSALGGLLDCPHYTRPEVWRGRSTPPVLLSGDHGAIERWRQDQRQQLTRQQRPDLLKTTKL